LLLGSLDAQGATNEDRSVGRFLREITIFCLYFGGVFIPLPRNAQKRPQKIDGKKHPKEEGKKKLINKKKEAFLASFVFLG
jgi:hypothetical protein